MENPSHGDGDGWDFVAELLASMYKVLSSIPSTTEQAKPVNTECCVRYTDQRLQHRARLLGCQWGPALTHAHQLDGHG